MLQAAWPDARHATKRAVLRSALDCFNGAGLEATTIAALCEGSGQSVGTIYHHFGNKEGVAAALFFAAYDDQSRAIAERVADTPDAQAMVGALVTAYADWVSEQPDLARYLLLARDTIAKGPHADALTERIKARYDPIDARLADATRDGSVVTLPLELVPSLVLGPAESYARAWLAGRRQTPPGRHAATLAEAAWRSIAAPP